MFTYFILICICKLKIAENIDTLELSLILIGIKVIAIFDPNI